MLLFTKSNDKDIIDNIHMTEKNRGTLLDKRRKNNVVYSHSRAMTYLYKHLGVSWDQIKNIIKTEGLQ